MRIRLHGIDGDVVDLTRLLLLLCVYIYIYTYIYRLIAKNNNDDNNSNYTIYMHTINMIDTLFYYI